MSFTTNKLASIGLAALLLGAPAAHSTSSMTTLGVGLGPDTCPSNGLGPPTCGPASPPPPFTGSCTASQAFFTRASTNIAAATSAGAPGIASWEGAVDGLICGQVTGGTFALKDVEYMIVAPTPALANMNLVSASFPLAPGAAMTFAANAGLTGVASLTGFADTGYTPSSGQMTTSSALLGACVLNNRTTLMASSFLAEVGAQSASNFFTVLILTLTSSSSASAFGAGTASITVPSTATPTTQGGFFTSRTGASAVSAIANGTVVGTSTAGISSLTGTGDLLVLGLNASGTPFAPGGLTDTIGAVVIGGGESTAQVQADEALFTTALHAMGISSGC